MGLAESGKTSILSVVFEGKKPKALSKYKATLNYFRSVETIIDVEFQFFDCGGQENFLSAFMKEQAEFIFSNVATLVWIADVTDFDRVSTSKYYFNLAVERIINYSPDASIFCFIHKLDLLLPEKRGEVIDTMKQFFVPSGDINIQYHGTSIFDQSVFIAVGELIQSLIHQGTTASTLSNAVRESMEKNKEFVGIALFTNECVPVFVESFENEKILFSTKLWNLNHDQIREKFFTEKTFKMILETDNYVLVFQNISKQLILIGITTKVAPIQYIISKIDQLALVIANLL